MVIRISELEALERAMLNELMTAQSAYEQAAPEEQSAARQRYLKCLRRFSRLVLHGEVPEDKVRRAGDSG